MLSVAGVTLKGSESLDQILRVWGHEAWQEVFKQGLVSQQEFSSFAGGYWLRSREEWLAPLEADLHESFEVLELQESTVTDSHWEDYIHSSAEDKEKAKILAEAYCRFVFGVMGGVVSPHLAHRPRTDVDCVLDVMKAKVIELASMKPCQVQLSFCPACSPTKVAL